MSPTLKDLFDAIDAMLTELEEMKDLLREYINQR